MSARLLQWAGQAAAYAGFAAFVGYFSSAPAYTHLDPAMALVKVSFSHGAPRQAACRERSAEELAKLPPTMRRKMDCPRVRPTVSLELLVDGIPLIAESLPPSGLSKDGPSRIYRTIPVTAGTHTLTARLRDTIRDDGEWDYERTITAELAPAQNFVVDFRADAGGFLFR
ncbi:MAG: hypothetical protein IRZ04_02940 [Rhodospirillales bacterium]|nr:hypothetical protein [Rhodospirillales bacterium]